MQITFTTAGKGAVNLRFKHNLLQNKLHSAKNLSRQFQDLLSEGKRLQKNEETFSSELCPCPDHLWEAFDVCYRIPQGLLDTHCMQVTLIHL